MGEVRITIPYKPREQFSPFHERHERWACIVAHRRAGKTVSCINDLIRRAFQDGKEHGRYAYVAPYFSQAKAVAWDYLLRYSDQVRTTANASELWVELLNGARIRLFGADNPDALRGLYLDGVILDEVADMKPRVWGEIIRPLLSDREGWAVFIYTARGRNHGYKILENAKKEILLADKEKRKSRWFAEVVTVNDTKAIPMSAVDEERADGMPEELIQQEFFCSFDAPIVGAYYATQMAKVLREGRIGSVPYEPSLPVHTVWDIGMTDSTAIIFFQEYGMENRVIDYYENSGEGLAHYAKVLGEKDYAYGRHHAPWDIRVKELGTGKSRLEVAREHIVHLLE